MEEIWFLWQAIWNACEQRLRNLYNPSKIPQNIISFSVQFLICCQTVLTTLCSTVKINDFFRIFESINVHNAAFSYIVPIFLGLS